MFGSDPNALLIKHGRARTSPPSWVRGPWPPVNSFFIVRPYLLFQWPTSSLLLFGFCICWLNEWSGPVERLKDMSWVWSGANIGATSKLPIPPQGDNSPGGCALASAHTVALMAGLHFSRFLRSFLADGGDKAMARSRLERPRVYLCSAVPPHCCA